MSWSRQRAPASGPPGLGRDHQGWESPREAVLPRGLTPCSGRACCRHSSASPSGGQRPRDWPPASAPGTEPGSGQRWPGVLCRPSPPGIIHPVFPWGGHGAGAAGPACPAPPVPRAEGPRVGLSCIKFCDLCSWPCVCDCSRGGLTPQRGPVSVGSLPPRGPADSRARALPSPHAPAGQLCATPSPAEPLPGGLSEHEASLVLLTSRLRFRVACRCPWPCRRAKGQPWPLRRVFPSAVARSSAEAEGKLWPSGRGCRAAYAASSCPPPPGCSPGVRCPPPSLSLGSPFLTWGHLQLSSKSQFFLGSPAPQLRAELAWGGVGPSMGAVFQPLPWDGPLGTGVGLLHPSG